MMPLFEYHCLNCHTHFERLRPADQRDEALACPSCGESRVKRTISAFANIRVATPAGSAQPVATGGGHACGCGGNGGCR
jgi:putative FmdB family regulatory protein